MPASTVDQFIGAVDRGLRTVAAPPVALRPSPARGLVDGAHNLGEAQRAEAAALMRVNHVGEVCAQALYDAQALATRDERLRALFRRAAEEETDHLAWTRERVEALGGRLSLLNPLWYTGAFAIGLVAARAGDRMSLGCMAETERQVEAHLDGHLDRLPPEDLASRAVVEQMKADEVQHANTATDLGGTELPLPLRVAMRVAAKVMTTTAHRI
ncbi:MAG: 2-polyprenyl-3-methyl-6-methoxy-1,4-benzoquinone monooxygenase [Betaproteobacteria bacterium]